MFASRRAEAGEVVVDDGQSRASNPEQTSRERITERWVLDDANAHT